MISEIEVANVRLFEGDGWRFPLTKLSVFCGTNSAGKSTILKVPLLLRQSWGIAETTAGPPGTLRLVGAQADLGSFQSFVSQSRECEDIKLSITLSGSTDRGRFEAAGVVIDPESPRGKGRSSKMPVGFRLSAAFTFGLRSAGGGPDGDNVDVAEVATANQAILKSALFSVRVRNREVLSWAVSRTSTKGEPYKLTLPRSCLEGLTRYLDLRAQLRKRRLVFPTRLRGLTPTGFYADLKPSKSKQGNEDSNQANSRGSSRSFFPFPALLDYLTDRLWRSLRRTYYLAPLRAPAKRYYLSYGDVNWETDPVGESLPNMLARKSGTEVRVPAPGPGFNASKKTLLVGLNEWLHYLRTGQPLVESLEEVSVDTTKNVLVEFLVRSATGMGQHALADSGFGYSQVLPIIVRGLLAGDGSLFIVEQPELHLNPALQVRLAEFFVKLSAIGTQVIVETHSEHIVNAIRVLVAEDESGALAGACRVFFLASETGRPIVHEMSIQQDGSCGSWPQAFFGEALSLSGRLLRAQRAIRNRAQHRGPQ